MKFIYICNYDLWYKIYTIARWQGYFLRGAFVRQIDFNSISDWIIAQNNVNENDNDAEIEAIIKSEVSTKSLLPSLVSYSDDDSDVDEESTTVTSQINEEASVGTANEEASVVAANEQASVGATNEEEDTSKEATIRTEKPEDTSEENDIAIELEFIPISEVDFTLYP